MGAKNYSQKQGGFSFLRLLLLSLIIFCCLFIGRYCLNLFYYKIKKTNSGLIYWVVPYKDNEKTAMKTPDEETAITTSDEETTMKTSDEKTAITTSDEETAITTPDEKEHDCILLYEQEILYKGEIIKHRVDFRRKTKHKGIMIFVPYFERIDKTSLKCIDGDFYELLSLSRLGVVLEAEILAYKVLEEDDLIKYKLFDKNSKVNVRIYPIAFCSYDKLDDELEKYDKRTVELQKTQMNSNKERIKYMLEKRKPQSTYIEIENGFIIETKAGSEPIKMYDYVCFDVSLYDFTNGELLFTTAFDEAKKNGKEIDVEQCRPIYLNVNPNVFHYFEKLSDRGEYEFYTPLYPKFLGDKQLYLFKIKNLQVRVSSKRNLNVQQQIPETDQEISNKDENQKEEEEVNDKSQENIEQIENEEQEKKAEGDGEKQNESEIGNNIDDESMIEDIKTDKDMTNIRNDDVTENENIKNDNNIRNNDIADDENVKKDSNIRNNDVAEDENIKK